MSIRFPSHPRVQTLAWVILCFVWCSPAIADPLLPPVQAGDFLRMTNGNVRLDYDLSSGRANFYWQNRLVIAGFYSGVGLDAYITGTIYTSRTWTTTSNQVEVTSNKPGLPFMRQVFILDQPNSFLTRVDLLGPDLKSRWMGPVVMDMPGGVDIGSYADTRALVVPYDNDSFSFSYGSLPVNTTSSSYEVGAFYDNATRNGLVVGSVTHETWKTGVYFQGSNNKLNILNVYGGVTSSDTRDVVPHGLVTGNAISSPTVFVGFHSDWRTAMEEFADANTSMTPKRSWDGGVPFGWNSWYAHTSGLTFSNAIAASSFIKNQLQTNHFHNRGVVYINLDSYWSNLSDNQLVQLVNYCRSNGQRAGVYWAPFVYWGTASQGSNSFMTATSYKWSNAYLRTPEGNIQSFDGGIAIDPTHPGTRQMISYYLDYFKTRGFEFLKLDFLSHGALEGAHFDPNISTGIQAYNQGMAYLAQKSADKMFLSQAISPIFPYHHAHSRRIACDTSTTINETAFQLLSVTYGWWINNRLYQFSDPDVVKFAGGTAHENQSRLISALISGTVFLNGDDLTSVTGRDLAKTMLTRAPLAEIARAGVSFRPVEGNSGSGSTDVFVRQDGTTWYVAVFNFSAVPVLKSLSLSRLGIAGTHTAEDLWSSAVTTIGGSTWNVSLGARQAKVFRLGLGNTTALGPTNQSVFAGDFLTLTTTAAGSPPFQYRWLKDGVPIGQNANTITVAPVSASSKGAYTVEVTGGLGSVTNTAHVTVVPLSTSPINLTFALDGTNLILHWPMTHTGWRLQANTNRFQPGAGFNWFDLPGSDLTNRWVVPLFEAQHSCIYRLIYQPHALTSQ